MWRGPGYQDSFSVFDERSPSKGRQPPSNARNFDWTPYSPSAAIHTFTATNSEPDPPSPVHVGPLCPQFHSKHKRVINGGPRCVGSATQQLSTNAVACIQVPAITLHPSCLARHRKAVVVAPATEPCLADAGWKPAQSPLALATPPRPRAAIAAKPRPHVSSPSPQPPPPPARPPPLVSDNAQGRAHVSFFAVGRVGTAAAAAVADAMVHRLIADGMASSASASGLLPESPPPPPAVPPPPPPPLRPGPRRGTPARRGFGLAGFGGGPSERRGPAGPDESDGLWL
jgi:hypothetical protein